MGIRKARTEDIVKVQRLVNEYAKRNQMIPRSLNDLYENIRDIYVSEDNDEINGACALHVVWEDLAEIRSLAVAEDHQGKGIGKNLIRRAVKDAGALGVKRIFSLTYVPGYFRLFGFHEMDKSMLPHKIWGDCIKCHKFPECDETAVIKEL